MIFPSKKGEHKVKGCWEMGSLPITTLMTKEANTPTRQEPGPGPSLETASGCEMTQDLGRLLSWSRKKKSLVWIKINYFWMQRVRTESSFGGYLVLSQKAWHSFMPRWFWSASGNDSSYGNGRDCMSYSRVQLPRCPRHLNAAEPFIWIHILHGTAIQSYLE